MKIHQLHPQIINANPATLYAAKKVIIIVIY
jgi:hypothetical protein